MELDIHPNVDYVAHAVAKNEYRSLFPLTSITNHYWQSKTLALLLPGAFGNNLGNNAFDPSEYKTFKGNKYWEQPFSGAHSDIGGGYDSRNINALNWMIGVGQAHGVPFRPLSSYPDYKKIRHSAVPHDSRYAVLDWWQGDRVIFPGNINVNK